MDGHMNGRGLHKKAFFLSLKAPKSDKERRINPDLKLNG
jgi:hypothetical protein